MISPRLIIDVNNGWPSVLIFASELQFHLWLRNWCWHSFTAWWNPRNTATTSSGNLAHNFRWCLVKPRLILQKANAFNFRLLWDCPRSFIMLLWFANVSARYSKWFPFSLTSSLVITGYKQWIVRTVQYRQQLKTKTENLYTLFKTIPNRYVAVRCYQQ